MRTYINIINIISVHISGKRLKGIICRISSLNPKWKLDYKCLEFTIFFNIKYLEYYIFEYFPSEGCRAVRHNTADVDLLIMVPVEILLLQAHSIWPKPRYFNLAQKLLGTPKFYCDKEHMPRIIKSGRAYAPL